MNYNKYKSFEDDFLRCPKCGSYIDKDSMMCKKCGYDADKENINGTSRTKTVRKYYKN